MNQLANLLETIAANLLEHNFSDIIAPFAVESLIASKIASKKPVVLLTHDLPSALKREEELKFFLNPQSVFVFEPPDINPYDFLPTSESTIASRMRAIARILSRGTNEIAIIPAESLMLLLPPESMLANRSFNLKTGEEINRKNLFDKLLHAGYYRQPLTEEVGDYSVRGEVIDIFSASQNMPIRLEFFGDLIERIRLFDPQNQRTKDEIGEVDILCAREIVIDKSSKERFLKGIKELADHLNLPPSAREEMSIEVREGRLFAGSESFLSLFYSELSTTFDYLNPSSLIIVDNPIELQRAIEARWEKIESDFYKKIRAQIVVPEPTSILIRIDDIRAAINRFEHISFGAQEESQQALKIDAQTHIGLRERIVAKMQELDALKPLSETLKSWLKDGLKVIIAVGTESDKQRLATLLGKYAIALFEADSFAESIDLPISMPTLVCGSAPQKGFIWEEAGLALITDQDIFGSKETQPKARFRASQTALELTELKEGDFVVHELFGVGIYRGLEHVKTELGIETDCVAIEYAEGDKLYVPVYRLNLMGKYIGGEGLPRLDRLGSGLWIKVKTRAKVAAKKLANELLKIYAERIAKKGHTTSAPGELFRELETTFTWRETQDQLKAIDEVLADLQSERPADRLICGDVGFGKTEVAIRAAFLSVLDGFQVALLAPTTTLVFQHLQTFKERLEPFGVRVEMLSRFVAQSQRKKIVEELKSHKIDVVIGTHALLSESIKFGNLGLLIVDEEQHFGVAQKEKIKRLKATVDVLSLSATPIPRTLYMGLSGIRDLSIINTPPENRLSIKTYLIHFDDNLIREALIREFERNGQAFFVHNRIQTITSVAARLKKLVPDARLAIAHGQMKADELEKIMIGFAQYKYDMLVSTAIIESGLDFPRANTIFIDRAETFGLAQLYQLRGRVGRSWQQASAYLIVPEKTKLTAEARKRLAAIKSFVELGSGFKIAQKDLEIRGAGNLLGAEQSGHIAAVGFELYMKLLNRAIAELKGEKWEEEIEPEIKLQVPAYIPDSYIPDGDLRLLIYQRLASVKSERALEFILDEIQDRFGPLPKEVELLAEVVRLKLECIPLRILELRGSPSSITAKLDAQTPVAPEQMVRMVQREPQILKLTPQSEIMLLAPAPDPESQIRWSKNLLNRLKICAN